MKIYAVQMTSSNDWQQNRQVLDEHFAKAAASQCQLVVLPEMFALFGVRDQTELAQQEREFNGPVGAYIRQQAKRSGCWVIAGTVPTQAEGSDRPRARCHVVNAQGEVVTHYDKIHLFDASVNDAQQSYRESDSYSHGSQPVVVETPWGKLGLAVCYDLRFAEVFRQLSDLGAQLIVLPSAFTYVTGKAHWQILNQARAIENGVFMLGVNQTGQHDANRRTWGHTLLVHPEGQIETLNDAPGALITSIDFNEIEQFRQRIPVQQHRRL